MTQESSNNTKKQNSSKKVAFILAPKVDSKHRQNINNALSTFTNFSYDEAYIISGYLAHPHLEFKKEMKVVSYPATSKYLDYSLQGILDSLKSTDMISIYTTGHGGLKKSRLGNVGFLSFQDVQLTGQEIWGQIKSELADIKITVIADQCYGFNFIEPIMEKSGRIGISASERNKPAFSHTFPNAFFPAWRKLGGDLKRAFLHAYFVDGYRKQEMQFPQYLEVVKNQLEVTPDLTKVPRTWLPE